MQSSKNIWKKVSDVIRPRRFSIKRVLLEILGFAITLQTVVVLVLEIISLIRRQNRHNETFPHLSPEEVVIGENTVQIYAYGHDLYDSMLSAIDTAQKSIYLETYIWKDDQIGQEFKHKLICKANQGVEVYVIFDSFANTVVPGEFKVFPTNIHVLKYQSFNKPWYIFDPRRYALDHRKILVVDDSIGFIGGFNLGSLYETSWRDTHLRMNGPATAHLAQSFIDFWNQHTPDQDHISQHNPRSFDPLINLRGTSALRLTFPIRDMYIEAIDKAEHSILLTNAYFVPDRVLLGALKAAAKRGVNVEILVPWISNHVVVDWLTRGHFSECLKAGIRVFGYHNMLHAKTCTIDGEWSTIGTANLDRLSSVGNYEINVEVYSKKLAHQMEELFKCDKSNSFELTLEQWLKRPWYANLSEKILSPLRALL
ncbi:MAG: phospholipase D-like domain-containing protein [Ktedonobacteraceae bacterium]